MIKNLDIHITKPIVIDIDDLDLKKLNLFIGTNASGKSLILKMQFALCTIAKIIEHGEDPIKTAQYVIDHTFEPELSGKIWANFINSGIIAIDLVDHKVVDVVHKDLREISPCMYLSSSMRKFDAISHYLALRNNFSGSDAEIVDKMLDSYKLYDVIRIETLIKQCPIKINFEVCNVFNNIGFVGVITEFGLNSDNRDFYLIMDGNKRNMCSFSDGEQSLVNMLINSNS